MTGLGRAVVMLSCLALPAGAQTVVLELRPRVGDTLRMRLDQETEITGGREGAPTLSVRTTVKMFSRAIVVGVDGPAVVILAVTDSVAAESNDEHALALVEQARRGLEGRSVRLRLVPDGTVALTDPDEGARDVREMVSIMPGSFPKESIDVGDTWMREMPIPGSAQMRIPSGGLVRARFRLDSLSRNGDLAYVSMRGSFVAANTTQRADAEAGSVSGAMVVNRRRGWLTESRFLIQMRTTVPATASSRLPMRFRTTIRQSMKVLGEREP